MSWTKTLLSRAKLGGILDPETALPLAAALLLLVVLGWNARWVTDDAFIDFRIVQNVLAGHGPVFNVGERVEAYTNPLWVALLSALGSSFALVGASAPLEWISVVCGLTLSVTGAWAAGRASNQRLRNLGRTGPFLPLGIVVYLAVAPARDFLTSGLESGMSLGWLGLNQWILERKAREHADNKGNAIAQLSIYGWLGLGPLIRPDLVIFSVVFVAAALLIEPRLTFRTFARRALALSALPLLYELFRAGYFGTLLPNTALAKEAGRAWWSQGGAYLWDFANPYFLWLPILVLATWTLLELRGLETVPAESNLSERILLLTPIAAGLMHATYVVRVGGDFMHGRLLLPSLFSLLVPYSTVAGARAQHTGALALVLGAWALWSGIFGAPPYEAIGPHGIANERSYYAISSTASNPVTMADHRGNPAVGDGGRLAELAARRRTLLLRPLDAERYEAVSMGNVPYRVLSLGHQIDEAVVVQLRTAGLHAYAAGPSVHVLDLNGLTDPMTARLELGTRRGRPGHEKSLPNEWMIALFTDPALKTKPLWGDPARVAAARQALRCGDLAALRAATRGPLSLSRFMANLAGSWKLTRLRIPSDPRAARTQFCGG